MSQPPRTWKSGAPAPAVLICGMPRSATTWIYNVVLSCLTEPARWTRMWVPPGGEEGFSTHPGPILGKCHHYDTRLAERADLVIHSWRDIRMAAVSAKRRFGDCGVDVVAKWIEDGERWRAVSHCCIRYEDVVADPEGAVRRVGHAIRSRIGHGWVGDTDGDRVRREVDARFTASQEGGSGDYDSATLIFPGHRTFVPAPEAMPAAERQLYETIGRTFESWLDVNGYLPESHGQGTDYALARLAIEQCGRTVVVDVGAERGSFVALARSAGAAEIHAYEPLPRHVEALRSRFDGDAAVKIRPCAVSDVGGKADLHIAIDQSGRELDFHHTLSAEVGDTDEAIRSVRKLAVETVALAGEVGAGRLPERIGFLKIDTDGHDLAVLRGLGDCRPSMIMAEFWDDLPKTSGKNPYSLADLVSWARAHAYPRHIVIRRHGRIETVAVDEAWSTCGDWGNVLFFTAGAWESFWNNHGEAIGRRSFERMCDDVDGVIAECEAKETEIRRLAEALEGMRKSAGEGALNQPAGPMSSDAGELAARGKLIDSLDRMLREANADRSAQAGVIAGLDARCQESMREMAATKAHAQVVLSQLSGKDDELRKLATESDVRARLLTQLDAQLKEANADRVAQARLLGDLEARLREAERLAASAQEQAAAVAAQLAARDDAQLQSSAELAARAQLLARLDGQLKEANADRVAQAQALAELQFRRQEAERSAAAVQEQATAVAARLAVRDQEQARFAADLEARAQLLAQLDRQLKEANADRVAQARALAGLEARHQEAERSTAALQEQVAVVTARLVASDGEQVQTAGELEARARLIAQLDGQLREANADRVARGEVIGGLQARIGELERRVGELAAVAESAVADERKAAEANAALYAARERLESLRSERGVLQEQVVEIAASAEAALQRAEAAERECAARQVVIDELVRARDAYAAALAGRPRPWYAGLLDRVRRKP